MGGRLGGRGRGTQCVTWGGGMHSVLASKEGGRAGGSAEAELWGLLLFPLCLGPQGGACAPGAASLPGASVWVFADPHSGGIWTLDDSL